MKMFLKFCTIEIFILLLMFYLVHNFNKKGKIFMKKLLIFYIVDICIMFFSFYLLFLVIKAHIEHDNLALMGLLPPIWMELFISSIVSTVVFVTITITLIKYKRKK